MFHRLTEAYTQSQTCAPEVHGESTVEITLEHAYRGGPTVVYTTHETRYVDLPAGVDDREVVMVAGHPYKVRMTNDTKFVRKGIHLYYTHTITLREALGGFVLALDHLDGTTIRITKDTGEVVQPGQKKTISNYGMRRGGVCGDLIVTFDVVLPTKLSPEQRECLRLF